MRLSIKWSGNWVLPPGLRIPNPACRNAAILFPVIETRLFSLEEITCCMCLSKKSELMMSWNRVYQQLSSSAAIHASHQHRLATSMSSSSERGFIYLIHRLVYRYDISSLSGMLPYESGQTHKITWHEQCSNDLHTFTIELSPALSLLYINLIQRPLHLFRKVVLSSSSVQW